MRRRRSKDRLRAVAVMLLGLTVHIPALAHEGHVHADETQGWAASLSRFHEIGSSNLALVVLVALVAVVAFVVFRTIAWASGD